MPTVPMLQSVARLKTAPHTGAEAGSGNWGFDVERDAFFFDVDGTLLDIADHPDGVVVPEGLGADLLRLRERAGGALALVSGRTIARLDAIFAPVRLIAAGAHGAEMRPSLEGDVEHMTPALPAEITRAALDLAHALGDLLVEDKGASLAIHYRTRPSAKRELEQGLSSLARRAVEPLVVLPGHMVFELKPAGRDKGRAIDGLMQIAPFTGRRPVFIGDDVTDEAGFAAVLRHGGLPISVGRAFENVDVVLPRPADVRDLVHRLSL